MPSKKIALAVGLFLLAVMSARPSLAQTYSFQTLDDPSGAKATTPTGINDLGQVVGTYTDASSVDHGFTYTGGVFSDFSVPGSSATFLSYGINDSGAIVGTYTGNHGFIYSGGMLTTLDDPSAGAGTFARGINNAGMVVGYYARSGGVTIAFSYAAGTYTDTLVNSDNTRYYGVNNLGTATGYLPYETGYNAFNQDSNGGGEVYAYDHFGISTQSFGINDGLDGDVNSVGQYTDSSGVTHGFFELGSNDLSTIDVPGAFATTVYGINNSYEIVGTYTTPDNVVHGFIGTPVPEPMSAALWSFGLLAAVRRRRE